jgi:hypothetical protein
VFQPHPSEHEPEEEKALIQLLESSCQLEPPIKRFKSTEVQEVISNLNPKKSSGYDFIPGKIPKELPIIGIQYLTQLKNGVFWDVTPCGSCNNRRFRGGYFFAVCVGC